MRISELHLKNFRNYEDLELEFGPGINVFYGQNGQGKTNVLEAIYLTTCARSHRHASDVDMIRFGTDAYEVLLRFLPHGSYQEELQIQFFKAQRGDPRLKVNRRQVFHDGLQLPRISDLPGIFNAVIFAPEDLMMVKEGPATRRQFLDLLLSQVHPSYFRSLQNFSKHLRQRNALLKQLRDDRFASRHTARGGVKKSEQDSSETDAIVLPNFREVQLDTWTEQYATFAVEIIFERWRHVARLEEAAAEFHREMSQGKEEIHLRYRTVSGLDQEMSVEEIYEHLIERLRRSQEDDIERGSTSIGPHRDDLEFRLNDRLLKIFGSQGQQRSAVLSLKMAELEIMRRDTGRSPVLLLDDVMSELDASRRQSLIQAMADCQVFITCTDPEQIRREYLELDPERDLRFFQVSDGHAEPVERF